jgi:hypothetical protein
MVEPKMTIETADHLLNELSTAPEYERRARKAVSRYRQDPDSESKRLEAIDALDRLPSGRREEVRRIMKGQIQ